MCPSSLTGAPDGRFHSRCGPLQPTSGYLGGNRAHPTTRWVRILVIMGLALTSGAAAEARSSPHPAAHPSKMQGTASWYGWRQHGHRMANGQLFHALGTAAASPVLPLGSRVKVTNLSNRRAAWVTIQDREPATRGRVVDVSLGTARALGMEKKGLTKVRLEVSKEHAAGGGHARAAPRRHARGTVSLRDPTPRCPGRASRCP
jgi:rare lipoprotein A (peptidoglycan hydrolase)